VPVFDFGEPIEQCPPCLVGLDGGKGTVEKRRIPLVTIMFNPTRICCHVTT
jgi:hypothetical protein